MRTSVPLGAVLGGAALAILAGCSGAGSGTSPTPASAGSGPVVQSVVRQPVAAPNVLPPRMQSKVHPTLAIPTHIGKVGSCPTAPVGFISDYNLGAIYELNSSGAVCATLTGFSTPEGLATDQHGNLYVANTSASTILVINESSGSIVDTYQDPGEFPCGVCVAHNSGNFAVTNIESTSGTAGNVVLYTAGTTSGPTGSASASNYTSPRFCAFDKQMNAFAFDDDDLFNTLAMNVGAIIPRNYTGTKTIVPLSTSNTIAFVGGTQVNGSNQLVIDDQSSSPPSLYTYSLSGTMLTLTTTTPMTTASDPVSFAFAPGYHLFLTADANLVAAQLYHYPAGGNAINTFMLPSGGLPIDAAINPTAQFAIHGI